MPRYRLALQYVGTRYAGWQIQKNRPTIQGKVQEALSRLAGSPVSVVGAGRTDSGVHARGQIAHCDLPAPLPADRILRALNGMLPWDIRVARVGRVDQSFHAQRDALNKRYEYRIYNGRVLPPFLHNSACHIIHPLNLQAMQRAAELVTGRHDFSGFAAASTTVRNRRRRVMLSRVGKRGRHLTYRIEADGFLHHMVRNIAGTLIQVGLEKRDPGDIRRILRSRDRRRAGPTAPAHGLYLVKVRYLP